MLVKSFSFLFPATLISGALQPPVLAQDRSLDQMLPEYSRCVAARKLTAVKAFVLSPQALESGAGRKTKRPTSQRCAYAFTGNEEASFIASWYRDELALALVKLEFADRGPQSFADKGELAHPRAPVRGGPRFIYEKLEYDNSRLGECVARRHPERARSWIISSPDAEGDKQDEVIDTDRKTCSRELGASFTGDRTRAAIARGYYRLAHSPSTRS